MKARVLWLTIACWLAFGPQTARAQGYSPDEAPRRMSLHAGLQAKLVAAEPLVRQPVAIEFDDRGRLWAIQYLQYPNPAGLKRAKVDRYSRTTYDRVPEPPPLGPQGADRITILDDTDGDGRADHARDFVSGLNLTSGLAFGHGGVFVLQVPYLLFYTDRNRDDVPDGDPQVLLSGFGMDDAHSVANSLTWGPDGWLYGCQGSTVTSNIRGIEFQQGVWRYHPLTHAFELFCEGGGNSWGLDFDAHGNLFYSTNFGGYAMLHGVQGGYYWKQFGKHGALHNPHAYGYFDHVSHDGFRGGHVTVGGTFYQGTLLPAELRGKYIGADLLGHAVYAHEVSPRGSTFSARYSTELLQANDTWFAPSDLTIGPDGAIYVTDWHDQRTAHPDPDAEWDRTNGRIYRITAAGSKRANEALPDFAMLPSAELLKLLDHENDWLARRARRVLADRRDPEVILPLRTLIRESGQQPLALRALWALYVSGGLSDEFAAKLLEHPNPDVRWWTVRLLGDEGKLASDLAARFARLAADDESLAVRTQLACTAKRLSAEQALPIIEQLLRHDADAADPYQPLLVWWAIEAHAVAARERLLTFMTQPAVQELALVRQTIAPRLIRRSAAEASPDGYRACVRLLAAAPAAQRPEILAALDAGLAERNADQGGSAGTLFENLAKVGAEVRSAQALVKLPPSLPAELIAAIESAWREAPDDFTRLRLAARSGHQAALDRARSLANDANAGGEKRIEAVRLLGQFARPEHVDDLLAILANEQAAAPLRQAALESLQAFNDDRVADELLTIRASASPALRNKLDSVLLSRRAWALLLLKEVDAGQIPPGEIALEQLRLVSVHGDRQLDELVKKHWGAVQGGSPEERLAEMRRISNDLRAASGNPTVGKELFARHCGVCHRLFGEGNNVGPELTHANRHKTDELLAAIVDPSATIRKEYMNFVVQTGDGRVLSGIIVESTPASLTLLTAKNERVTLAREAIETLTESPTSLMPDNVLTTLKPQELRDLFAYLQSEPTANSTGENRRDAPQSTK